MFSARSYCYLALLTLLSMLLLVAIAADRAFENRVKQFNGAAVAAVSSVHELPFLFYSNRRSAFEALQAASVAITGADVSLAWNTEGKRMAEYSPSSRDVKQFPDFAELRQDSSSADTTSTIVGADGYVLSPGLWSALIDEDAILYSTIPVFSLLDPTRDGLTQQDFSLARVGQDGSRVLVAF